MNKQGFTLEHTNYCKGIAIVLMIIHHLFWNVSGIGYQIGVMSISQRIAIIGKVCVSIFLILSGIGLYKSTCENMNIKKFYREKLLKLYVNYIFIVATSILIILLCFNDKYSVLIGNGLNGVLKILLTFTGLQYIFGYQFINPSWWFITVILLCYIFFPLIRKSVEKYNIKFIVVMFFISLLSIFSTDKLKFTVIISWFFPFILGVYIAYSNILVSAKKKINSNNSCLRKICVFFLLIVLLFMRQEIKNPLGFWAIKLDYLLAFIIILNVYIFWNQIYISKKIFCFLGKKSMNMYYVHMFISTYLLNELIYGLNNWVLMVIAVIILSLVWNYILEIIRSIIKLDKLFII